MTPYRPTPRFHCSAALATLVGTLLMAGAAPALAQVYKCVGSDGKTVYAQSPCPAKTKSSTIRQGMSSSSAPAEPGAAAAGTAASAGPKTAAEQEVDFQKRRQAQADAAKKDADKAEETRQKAENCTNAKSTLASLQQGGRQTRMNDKGERYFLSDDQLAQETSRAKQAVGSWCTPAG